MNLLGQDCAWWGWFGQQIRSVAVVLGLSRSEEYPFVDDPNRIIVWAKTERYLFELSFHHQNSLEIAKLPLVFVMMPNTL